MRGNLRPALGCSTWVLTTKEGLDYSRGPYIHQGLTGLPSPTQWRGVVPTAQVLKASGPKKS